MKSPEELTELFRASGLKVTPQRQRIFQVLHGSEVHPTAEAVYAEASAAMPTMSLKTVYQTLHELADLGELQLLDVGTGAARFDPNVGHHHHLVCIDCGMVRDVVGEFPSVRVPAGREQGFAVEAAEIIFRGRCAACQPVTATGPRTSRTSKTNKNRPERTPASG